MLTSALLMVLCAAPIKIAATGFTASGDDAARASVWLERFAEVMRREPRISISTAADFAQLIGMERQRELLGCASDATSCIAELANALGADGVLVGSITRTGDSYIAVVRVLRPSNGSIWWSASSRMKGEPALLDWLDDQAVAASRALAPAAPMRSGPLVVGLAGGALIVTGAVLLTLANTSALRDVRSAQNEGELAGALSLGRAEQIGGFALIGVGTAAVATAVVWQLVRVAPPAAVAVIPLQGGALATFGAHW